MGVVSSRASAASDELSEAKARITAAQQEADEAAAEFDAAQTRYFLLQDELQRTELETERARARANALIGIVRERAVVAYKSGGGGGDVLGGLLGGTSDALENAHRSVMLNHANAESQDALNEVRVATDELRNSEEELRRILDTQARELEQMKSRQAEMQSRIANANAELEQVKAKLERERRINEYNELVEEARAEARAAAVRRQASTPPPQSAAPETEGEPADAPVRPQPPPPASGMVCPVAGPVSFSDTYGSPRSGGRGHKGVDMFAAAGTPVVAILPGSVFYQADPVGGLSVYLQASDGNTYYYTHLMDYVGGARSVQAGEVLGHVGTTGNAFDAPPQLHFERRIGGPNGERVNPYATVRPIC